MAEKNKLSEKKDANELSLVMVPKGKTEEVRIVCPVCGYANPNYTALCKMCSNYLTKGV